LLKATRVVATAKNNEIFATDGCLAGINFKKKGAIMPN